MEYIFTLKYQLAEEDRDLDVLVERLGEAGCDDALVGIGQPGRLALEFTREAIDATAAVRSALVDVCSAIPSARLIEVAPDLVGLTDVADIVGVSRQNMRKLMLAHPGSFPAPVHEGSASIWHLADVLAWLQAKGSYSLAKDVLDVARVALQVNVAKEGLRLPRSAQNGRTLQAEICEILATAVKPEGRVKLGDLLADIGRKVKLTDEEMAVFDRDQSPARAVSFE